MVYGLKVYLRDILLGDLLTQKYPTKLAGYLSCIVILPFPW